VRRTVAVLCVVATTGAVAVVGVLPSVEEAGGLAAPRDPPVPRVAWLELGEGEDPEPGPSWPSQRARIARAAGAEIEEVWATALAEVELDRYAALVLRERADLSSAALEPLTRFLGRGGGVVLWGRADARDRAPAERSREILSRLVPGGRDPSGDGAEGLPRLRRGRYGAGPVVWVPRESSADQVERALRWALRQPAVEIEGSSRDRSRVRVRMESIGPGRIEVELHNLADRPVRQVGARVYLPVGAGRPRARAAGWFAPRPVVRVAPDRSWVSIVLAALDADETARYAVRYAPPLSLGRSSESGSVAGNEQARPRQM
jgi:hypothetical protein